MVACRLRGAGLLLATVLVACLGAFGAYPPITTVSLDAISRATGADTSALRWVTSALVLPMVAFILSAPSSAPSPTRGRSGQQKKVTR